MQVECSRQLLQVVVVVAHGGACLQPLRLGTAPRGRHFDLYELRAGCHLGSIVNGVDAHEGRSGSSLPLGGSPVRIDAVRTGLAPLAARLLVCAIFMQGAFGKITGWSGQAEYMASHGMRFIPPLLGAALVIEVLGVLALLSGYQARIAALVMFVYLAIVSVTLHNFWALSGMSAGSNQTAFLKN